LKSFLRTILFVTAVSLTPLSAQSDSATVIPGERYRAGGFHEFMFGKLWRNLWTTPVTVPVIDLSVYKGGLTPYRLGGGRQTRTLHFKGGDGKFYKFRSVDKDPTAVLPEEVQNTFVTEFAQDQIATSNPLAPMLVAPFLDAVGVYHSAPTLFILPDSPILGEWRDDFKNVLGFLEEHPDETDDPAKTFGGADKVQGTEKLLFRLAEKRDEKIDALSYLTVRLIDILTGDWDRHIGQWRWIRIKNASGEELWKPVPKDRDRAFSKFDGFVPYVTTLIIPQWKPFEPEYPNILDMTWSGRYLDRRILTSVTRQQWDSVTAFVYDKITDELIEKTFRLLPADMFKQAGMELITTLKARRDKLKSYSVEFYTLINSIAEIRAFDKDDYLEVYREADKTTVGLYKRNKNTGAEEKDERYFYREFDNDITGEIRVYMGDGDDSVYVYGKSSKTPILRVAGDKGKDRFTDKSVIERGLLDIFPSLLVKGKNRFYDSGNNTKVKKGNSTSYYDDEYEYPDDTLEYFEPTQLYEGRQFEIEPILEISAKQGVIFGGGYSIFNYDFRKKPFDSRIYFGGSYATGTGSYKLEFDGTFNSVFEGAEYRINVVRSDLSFTNYYGYGNETAYDHELDEKDFYRMDTKQFRVTNTLTFPLSKNTGIFLRAAYEHSYNDVINRALLANFPMGGYGASGFDAINLGAGFTLDTRDNVKNPEKGVYLNASGNIFPRVFSNEHTFTRFEADLRTYLSGEFGNKYTLALRAAAEITEGNHPFFYSSFMGGRTGPRGFRSERFSGKAAVIGQTELRYKLAELKMIIVGDFGFHGFIEAGRVFADGETSDKWHKSYGGGIWISYFEKFLNLVFTVAVSDELTGYYFSTRFSF